MWKLVEKGVQRVEGVQRVQVVQHQVKGKANQIKLTKLTRYFQFF